MFMIVTRFRALPVLVIAMTCAAMPAAAQEGQRRPRPGPEGPAPAGEATLSTKDSIALANALDQFAMVQAQRTLELSEPQYAQFVPLLRELQQLKRRNFQARNRLLQELRRLVRGGRGGEGDPDDAALTATLQKLRENDERAASELKAAYDALDAVMTPRQRARFRLFEEQIEGRKLELLMNARTRAARGGS
jgi:hypothetical protein